MTIQQIYTPPRSSIGTLVLDVTISEQHRNPVVMTQNPLAGGGFISDHSYAQPKELVIVVGISDVPFGLTDPDGQVIQDNTFGSSTPNGFTRGEQAYNFLVGIRDGLEPIDVQTKLFKYNEMVLVDITTTTDKTTYNAPVFTLTFKEPLRVFGRTVALEQSRLGQRIVTKPDPEEIATKQPVPIEEPKSGSIAAAIADFEFYKKADVNATN